MAPMDRNTRTRIDALLVRLHAGDQSVVPAIIEAFNARQVPAGTLLIQGSTVIIR